ncbi:MAG: hypothetical protein IJ733_04525, partial [Lachnospiraceae bacterium]|nr:hypothetical protein [Lachnospiraceae bacterium]
MRKKLWKRVVAVGLCSALLLGAVPSQRSIVWAEESTEADETTETEEPEATEKPAEAEEQTISLKVSKKTYTADQFRTGKKTFKIGASAKTALTYKVTSGSKYVSVNQSGLVTIKRWTPKGTYKISVTAKATEEYKKATKTVTVNIKAGKAVMSKVPMKWDLKNKKTVKYTACYSYSIYAKSGLLKVKNLKKVKSGKNNKVTCTLQWTRPTKFDPVFVDEIGSTAESGYTTEEYCAVVDYQTGEYLYNKNRLFAVWCESLLHFVVSWALPKPAMGMHPLDPCPLAGEAGKQQMLFPV